MLSREKSFDLGSRTIVMGILNVTPDSFSDGGEFDSVDKAVKHAKQMIIEFTDYDPFPVDIHISFPPKRIEIMLHSLENQHGNTLSERFLYNPIEENGTR